MRITPVFLALCLAAGAAQAALTPVNARGGGDGAERCLAGLACAGGAYSGALSIVAAFERDLGLAAGSLQRIDDAFDRQWAATGADAAFRPFARYAGDRSALGISGGGALPMRKLADSRVWVDHPRRFSRGRGHGDFHRNRFPWYELGAGTSPFAFVLHNFSSSLRLSSDPSLAGFSNSGLARDWMVSYRVPGEDLYLLAFEDRAGIGANGLPGDYDYNDFVFMVRGAAPVMALQEEPPVTSPVPLPPALVSLLLGLAGLGLSARMSELLRRRALSTYCRGSRGSATVPA